MAAGSRRRGSRRAFARRGARVPMYARIAIPLLLVLLIGRLVWRTGSHGSSHATAGGLGPTLGPSTEAWQRDVDESLANSLREAESGNITAATVSVDRAESLITAARLQSFDAKPEFFLDTNAMLDRVIEQHAQEATLFDHVTQARISLAELRSSLPPTGTDSVQSQPGATAQQSRDLAQNLDSYGAVRIGAPRQIAAKEILNGRSLGATYLDATLMPDTSEVLMPPTTRSFADGIRVEDITMEGASQTLDGIHWRNVTFIGTRLRYESGDLDLQNVRFVRCRFGFPSDDRGARLAAAIALGESSIRFSSLELTRSP